jgi:poly-beta-1,6-N-acetyl-D-glucosamine synthase
MPASGSPPHVPSDRPALHSFEDLPTSTTSCAPALELTVIVPAYNEAASVGDTVRSLLDQTLRPVRVLVVDDGSSDDTGDVARAAGADVVRPPKNTGSKAGAQTFALPFVDTPYVMAVDADTTLERDAIERLAEAFHDPNVAAASGFVIPRHVSSVWERGRYFEYLFAFGFFKQIQDQYRKPTISSGCFSMYRTDRLREVGGWSDRTLAEDMDLTWTIYARGWGVRFMPEAVCYPIEPHDLRLMRSQLRRWSHGMIQNLRLHWRDVLQVPFLRYSVGVMIWDATIATIAYFVFLPLLSILLAQPWPLLAFVIDIPIVLVPVLAAARSRREVRLALACVPGFFVLRILNAFQFLEAVWSEVIRGRRFTIYEKGH